jgi:hypothetical protein
MKVHQAENYRNHCNTPAAPAPAFEFMELGASVEPKAISNAGVVFGSSNTDQYPATAFRWSQEGG